MTQDNRTEDQHAPGYLNGCDPIVPSMGPNGNPCWGLTKRELFAAMAMQGAIAADCFSGPEQCAEYATKCADALLKELAK